MKIKVTRGEDEGEYDVHLKRVHRYAKIGTVSREHSSKWSWNDGGAMTGFAKTKKLAVEKLVASLPVWLPVD